VAAMSNEPNTPPLRAQDVGVWIFDLDNTLYPPTSDLFPRVAERMTAFIMREYGLDEDGSHKLRRDLFLKYGTTLRGLMLERDLDPKQFLDDVHNIDLSDVDPNPRLNDLITALPGRKLIFTNGSVGHASRIMAKLGIDHHFETVFDIVASDYIPKPDPGPYQVLIQQHGIDPTHAVMIEDMAKNLVPAHAMGMTTVWLRNHRDWAIDGSTGDHIHHSIDHLEDWLETVVNG
jgi:putative hydrolase of the HAD superfamily